MYEIVKFLKCNNLKIMKSLKRYCMKFHFHITLEINYCPPQNDL